MKTAIEQLCEDMAIVYAALHTRERLPASDPLQPELSELLRIGKRALSGHLRRLKALVRKHRSQCLLTPYARVRTHYLKMSDNAFSLEREVVLVMPAQDLILYLLDDLQSQLQKALRHTGCLVFERTVLPRLRQIYRMTAPLRRFKRRKRSVAP